MAKKPNGHGIGHNSRSGTIRLYRKWNYVDHDPTMDEVVSVFAKEGVSESDAATLSGVGKQTIANWRTRKTKRPQHATMAAALAGVGHGFKIAQIEKVDYASEMPKAVRWQKKA